MKSRRSRQEWNDIFKAWQASGLSAKAYCEQHRLPPSSFWKWQKRLAYKQTPTPKTAKSAFIDVTPIAIKPRKSEFASLRITLPNGCQIEVPL